MDNENNSPNRQVSVLSSLNGQEMKKIIEDSSKLKIEIDANLTNFKQLLNDVTKIFDKLQHLFPLKLKLKKISKRPTGILGRSLKPRNFDDNIRLRLRRVSKKNLYLQPEMNKIPKGIKKIHASGENQQGLEPTPSIH